MFRWSLSVAHRVYNVLGCENVLMTQDRVDTFSTSFEMNEICPTRGSYCPYMEAVVNPRKETAQARLISERLPESQHVGTWWHLVTTRVSLTQQTPLQGERGSSHRLQDSLRPSETRVDNDRPSHIPGWNNMLAKKIAPPRQSLFFSFFLFVFIATQSLLLSISLPAELFFGVSSDCDESIAKCSSTRRDVESSAYGSGLALT